MAPSKKAFFAILAGLAVIIAGGVGGFYLFDQELVKLNGTIGQLKADQQAAKSQIAIYETARQKIEELSFVKDLAVDVLPQEKEQANTVAELRKFVIDSGLGFESLTFTGPEAGSVGVPAGTSQTQLAEGLAGIRVLPATVTISAGAQYTQILDMLQKIETNQRKMQVTNITLVPDETGLSFAALTLDIDIYLSNGSSSL